MKISTLAQSQLAQEEVNRMFYLDGLRGVAILTVVLFYIFSRWPDLLPNLTQYGDFFLFKFGKYGVELFFIISGFIISMTIKKI